jgi:hypothetical protein
MNSRIGIGILFLVCIVAVIATIIYKTRSSGPASDPETLKINADGTLSFMESKKEYFMYVENSNGTKYTEDDPVHVRYYKNKATRGSIWNGMKTTSADMVQNTPCDEPDCVFVDTADRDTTTVLLNDIMDSVKPGLKDYRNYLYSKGLTNAIYKQQSQQMVKGKFKFDILFKGYLEYKGITVPDDLTLLNHSGSEFFKEIIKTFPIVAHWNFIGSMLTDALLKVKDDGKTALYLANHAGDLIEINIGADMDLFRGVFIIGIIKILIDNKDIGRVIYDPPAVMLSYKQMQQLMSTKME